MNNLIYFRDACFEMIRVDMHLGLRKLTSSWSHMSCSDSVSAKDYIRVLHPIETTDKLFNSIFFGDIVYYTTVFVGRV
jgi:hypothetical protein